MAELWLPLHCSVCGLKLLGQNGYPLLRCLDYDRWFELREDGAIVPLRIESLGRVM
jgi:hypothetical protein